MSEQTDRVHAVYDWYDGPRSGAADFRGRPHWYRSVDLYGEQWDPHDDRFELTPLSSEALGWALERDSIFRNWDAARNSGTVVWKDGDEESHGALPADMDRYRFLNQRLEAYLTANPPRFLARGSFGLGSREVRWQPIGTAGIAEPGTSPNGGLGTPHSSSGVTEGPPASLSFGVESTPHPSPQSATNNSL